MGEVLLFLDSGAYSASTKGVTIDIYEYIDFIKEHEDELDVYAVLDAIGDPEQTLKNQKIMEKAGLKPLPCFHFAEDLKFLEYYLDRYDYIALGGMVPIPPHKLRIWLDYLFAEYLCDKDGMPKVKVHGFGMTSFPLMIRYPWHSVDSTSWVRTGRMGSIYVPQKKGKKYDYTLSPLVVGVSNRLSQAKIADHHINAMGHGKRNEIIEYIHSKGYKLGKSRRRVEDKKAYKCRDNETWWKVDDFNELRSVIRDTGASVEDSLLPHVDIVEEIIEPGISNKYNLRDQMNLTYFLEMEKSMPKWPWAFRS